MSKRLYSHKRVRYWYVYDIDDICTLFADLSLHPQTVRKWIKGGLNAIDDGKPALVHGHDLIAYLKKNNDASKCKTQFNEMYCMKCHDARPVFQRKVKSELKNGFVKLSGHCRECKSIMFKSYKLNDLPQIRRTFDLVDVLELYDCSKPTDKTHIYTAKHSSETEPSQGELF